jgi:hypothetical protein
MTKDSPRTVMASGGSESKIVKLLGAFDTK